MSPGYHERAPWGGGQLQVIMRIPVIPPTFAAEEEEEGYDTGLA